MSTASSLTTAASAPSPAPSSSSWLVCHTRPRCEKKFASLLTAEGFEHYLALVPSIRKYANETKRFTKPLFPGYVFAHVPPARKNRLYQQDLLARTIEVTNESVFLRQLADVKTIVASGLEMSLHPLLVRGRRVRVIGGPLHGVEGEVDDPANPKGIVVSMDVLQQGLLVKVPLDHLRVLP